MKKYMSIFLSLILIMSLLPNTFAASNTYEYFVEAENYKDTNFKIEGGTAVISDTNSSNGSYLGVYTKSVKEFYAEYTVSVSKTGVYDLFLASSPVGGSSWSSKIYMSVNGGEETELYGENIASTNNSRIAWYEVGGVNLNSGSNTIKYIVRDKIDSDYYSAFIDCFGLNVSSFRLRDIDSDVAMNVFESGKNVSFRINANTFATANSTYAYTLKDVYGNIVKSGNVVISAGKSKTELIFENLKSGYYTLEVDTLKTAFSVVKALSERTVYSDTPFAIDTSFSNCSIWGVNRTDYAKILGLSGVSWIRDRIDLNSSASYSNGVYNFSNTKPQSTAKLLKPYGIQVSNAADYMPANIVNEYGTYISDDLIEVYKFWKQTSENYGDSVDNWEIFNEVDNGGTVQSWDSPDLYAAFMKAAAIGINDGSDAMMSVQGAMTGIDHENEYGKMLLRNGVLDYSAFDNTHHHRKALTPLEDYYEFPGKTEVKSRVNVQKSLNSRVPIWVTEAGVALEAAQGVELTKEQQLVQAKYLVTSAVESIANGTDKHFFFMGPRFHEDSVSWGMMSEETYKPYMYPSFSAQAAMTDILGAGIYKGVIDKDSDVSAYLFNNGVKNVIVAWSEAGEKKVSFNASGTVYDMWGNALDGIVSGESVTLDGEPVYIVCSDNSEKAENDRGLQLTAKKKEFDDAKRVVLLQKYSDVMRGGARTDGYMISSDNNTVTLEIANLSENTMTGQITYDTENGWKLDKEYEDVTVEPMSVVTVDFTIIPANGATTEYLSFVGTFDGQTTSKSTAKLVEVKNGIITLEAETDAKAQDGFTEYTQSGNQGLKVYTTTEGEYKITFDVVAAESGLYDLWTYGGILNYASCSNHVVKVNGRESVPSPKNTTNVSYSSGNNAIGWGSYNDVRLKKGVNSIEFIVSATRNSGDGYIASALDKIVLVPEGVTGYREAENYTVKTGMYYTESESAASDGSTMRLFTYGIENPITDNTLSYDFAVNEDGKYDVWVLSSQANASWLTKWKVGFDGSTPNYPSSYLQSVKDVAEIDGQSMYWYRIQNDTSLKRGIHTVKIEGSEKRTKENDYMFHIIDAVVVIKESSSSSWSNGWTPGNGTNNMTTNKINVLKKVLFTEYDLGNITDNISLPKNIEGAAISWSSSEPSVVSEDGVVNRPDKGNGDATVTLTAQINVDGTTSTANYNLTVKELTDEERRPDLQAEFETDNNGYSGVRMYVKNTDVLEDEIGNMPAVVIAKYNKTDKKFMGFVGEQSNTYTNDAGDRFEVEGNTVTCYITGANPDNKVAFVVYKEGTIPGKETIAYVNEYYPDKPDSTIVVPFEVNKNESAYRVVINKNGKVSEKVIHIFEGNAIMFEDCDSRDGLFVNRGIGRRIISTKGETEMPLWQFPTPENEEDIVYKVLLWKWNTLEPLTECTTLNN